MNASRLQHALMDLAAADGALSALHVFDELPSTNTWLAEQPEAAIDAAHAVIALHQTAGRGRQGKTWHAPAGSGLCLSVSSTYRAMPGHASALALALGVHVARALESIGTGEVMLKWPNDLVWQDRKLGGILVETKTLPDKRFQVIAGVGVNIALPDGFELSSDSSGWAEGVADLVRAGITPGIADVARAIIPEVVDCLIGYEQIPVSDTVEAFNRRHWLLERPATLGERMVRCAAVQSDGRLRVVDMLDGAEHDVDSADVMPLAWTKAS
ncbi:MAG: biotin--[acetyl-CoA-carboxylase] ligase [Pseudomonadota bacterium]